jgi:probable F420-dependent oxidoreductase
MAQAAEAGGVGALFVTDHPAPSANWLAAGGHDTLDPGIALAFVAAATRTIRLLTNVFVLGYRAPLLAAKTLASLDVLSGGRLTVGVAGGYLKSEFAALGGSFENRGPLLDDALEVLCAAWTGEPVTAEGHNWSARGAVVRPRPCQQPRPPIWCGGNGPAAMRRAVRYDGWMPFPTPGGLAAATRTPPLESLADLALAIARLEELSEAANRPERPAICVGAFGNPLELAFAEELHALDELGVEMVAVTLPAATRGEWLRSLEQLLSVASA